MKVLLIDVNCKYSSTGKIVYDLYTGIRNSGNDAAICYGRGPLVKEENIFKFGLDIETYIHAFLARITGLNGYFSPISTFRLLRYIKKYRPDVVHIHELHAYFVNIKAIIEFLKKEKIRTVWTFHCEYMYTGKCGQSNGCEKWKTECNDCPQLREYPKSYIIDRTRFMFHDKMKYMSNFERLTIITPSYWLAENVKNSFLMKIPVYTIHNGINTRIYRKVAIYNDVLGFNKGSRRVVVSVAPNILSEQKGGRWILDLALRMKDSKDIVFIMVGVTDTNINVPENVVLIPKIFDEHVIAQFYSIADMFLICSKAENLPTTCIEALACECPVYGFYSEGVYEVTIKYGVLVKYGDLNSLATVITQYFTKNHNDDHKSLMREYVEKMFSKESMINKYIDLYNNLIEETVVHNQWIGTKEQK